MSGVDFFKALQSRGHPAIRVMLTGFAALDNVIAAINDCNVYKYVTKPINGPDLLEVVKDAVVMRNHLRREPSSDYHRQGVFGAEL